MIRRMLLLFSALLLLASGLSACTREREPWPDTIPFDISAPQTNGQALPRFTPHVTTQAPIVTLTPAVPDTYPPTPVPEQPTPSPTPASNVIIYTVQPGDTLYDIAHRYNVSLQELAATNHITDPTAIMVGQQLRIP